MYDEHAANAWLPKLRRKEAARYLREVHGIPMQPSTLAKLFCIGGGPPAHVMGRFPLYPRVELDAWANKRLGRLRASTSDKGIGVPGHGS